MIISRTHEGTDEGNRNLRDDRVTVGTQLPYPRASRRRLFLAHMRPHSLAHEAEQIFARDRWHFATKVERQTTQIEDGRSFRCRWAWHIAQSISMLSG